LRSGSMTSKVAPSIPINNNFSFVTDPEPILPTLCNRSP
jgi:hypothetical protein